MTKKNQQAIARLITGVLTIFIILLTLKTVDIGLDLVSISDQNSNTESWRINSQGIAAANSVYNNNSNYRDSIYNSNNGYTKWISTSGKFTQLTVGFSLLSLSSFLCYIWYTYIASQIEKKRKRFLPIKSKKVFLEIDK